MERENQLNEYPVLPVDGIVMFPNMVMHFDVTDERSRKALECALDHNRMILVVAKNDEEKSDETKLHIYRVGVVAQVVQTITSPERFARVVVQGIEKARIANVVHESPYVKAQVSLQKMAESRMDDEEKEAFRRAIVAQFKNLLEFLPRLPDEVVQAVEKEKNIRKLCETIIFNTFLPVAEKQDLLESKSVRDQAKLLMKLIDNEIKVFEIERELHDEVKEAADKNQRDFFLREQLHVISRELGEDDDPHTEGMDYIEKIEAIGFDKDTEEKLVKECEKLMRLSPGSQEAAVVRTYLDSVLELPWNVYTTLKCDIKKAEKQLEKDHYGLKKVKERILEVVAMNSWDAADKKGQILCLVGPPGVGKTSVAKSVATALGRNFARVSLGGVHDEADIRGHRKTYVGAMPGRIAAALKQAKSMNPVMLFDEIDKMGNDYKGDPASAMLEVLDSEQNNAFRDHYLEIPMDLSDVLFITTANTLDTIPSPLLDRMEIIELGSYTREEKMNIAVKHLVPKQLSKHGLDAKVLKINKDAIYRIVDNYTKEAGVRKLERSIAKLCRKSLKKLVAKEAENIVIKASDLPDYLGVPKYLDETLSRRDEVGTVNGLAWTSAGGVLMPLEVVSLEGSGKIETTGSLGDVMKESAKIAVTLTRSLAKKYEIDPDFYKNRDIHIHAPEGAVPKDGPSAGVTMTTALVSALSGIPVKRDVAMTGEITLHGKVLAIGGLREKTMAAYKAGVKTVIIPKENEPDMKELDDVILDNVRFITAEEITTVLNNALAVPKENAISQKKRTTRKVEAVNVTEKGRKQTNARMTK